MKNNKENIIFRLPKMMPPLLLIILLIGLSLSTHLFAQAHEEQIETPDQPQFNNQPDINLAPNHPTTYTVVKGDTLWDISGKFLQNPWQWPEIWQINPHIKNPHLIYPGDILDLIYVDGKPQIVRRNGPRPTFKLSPKKRIEALDQSIPTIALEKLSPFLSGNIVVERDTLKKSPYIVGTSAGHLIAATGMEVYVRGIPKNIDTNRFGIFRSGDVYRDPKNANRIIGYEAIFLGDGFLKYQGKPSTLSINSAKAEILNGHRVIPLDDDNFNRNFSPKAANTKEIAVIISSLTSGIQSGVTNIGAFDVVIINLGTKNGIAVGDVFDIYRDGRTIVDPVQQKQRIKLPDEIAGNLLVFRTFKQVSYAIVMDATQVIKLGDVIRSPYYRRR